MKAYKERTINKVLKLAGIILFSTALLEFIIAMFFPTVIETAIGFCIAGMFALLAHGLLSDKDEYSMKFISYINQRLVNSVTLTQHNELLKEFEDLAIKNGEYILNMPSVMRSLHLEIINKINVLLKNEVK